MANFPTPSEGANMVAEIPGTDDQPALKIYSVKPEKGRARMELAVEGTNKVLALKNDTWMKVFKSYNFITTV
jgi:hypothetical protein